MWAIKAAPAGTAGCPARTDCRSSLSRANYVHSDAASQSGGWWQGCGAAYLLHVGEDVIHLTRFDLVVGVEAVAGVAHRKSCLFPKLL